MDGPAGAALTGVAGSRRSSVSDSLGPPGAGPADESIGAMLSRVRLEQGKSQLRVAELLCAASGLATITRHEISRWEREERIPGGTWLRWLAVVLDTPLDELERAATVARERRETTMTAGVVSERVPGPVVRARAAPGQVPRPAAPVSGWRPVSAVTAAPELAPWPAAPGQIPRPVASGPAQVPAPTRTNAGSAPGAGRSAPPWPAERAARRARLRELRRM